MKYIIWAYDYSHASAGPKTLHRLCHELNEAGQEAYIGPGWATNPEWNTPTWDGAFPSEEWITVYPEIVRGNPWNAPHVARWVLNRPGLLGGDREYDRSEMVFSFLGAFHDAPLLSLPTIELDIYTDRGEQRTGELYFVGKGTKGATDGAAPITLEMRLDRHALADALNKATLLRTFDDVSGMNGIAQLCGCPVLLSSGERLEPGDFRERYLALFPAFREQLARFIEVTQAPGKVCAVIPTRYRPPQLARLLALLETEGICIHLIVDTEDSDHRIYAMWNAGCDAARAHGARYIAVLNDDITLQPGTLSLLMKTLAADNRLGVVYPDRRVPWGQLPTSPTVEITRGDGFDVMTGYCFLFRSAVGVRFDESYRWWYGDNQFDKDVRRAGWEVARVVGVPIQHSDNGSAAKSWDYFAPLVAEDRRLWEQRGGITDLLQAPQPERSQGSSYR
jgi:hypothetical protein